MDGDDWETRPRCDHGKIRGLYPWPRCAHGMPGNVLRVQCRNGDDMRYRRVRRYDPDRPKAGTWYDWEWV